jgi:hypothetical protein
MTFLNILNLIEFLGHDLTLFRSHYVSETYSEIRIKKLHEEKYLISVQYFQKLIKALGREDAIYDLDRRITAL